MSWQSIETAPAGENFLVYMPTEDDGDRIASARKTANGILIIAGRFYFDCEPATHWQPLPEPPCDPS